MRFNVLFSSALVLAFAAAPMAAQAQTTTKTTHTHTKTVTTTRSVSQPTSSNAVRQEMDAPVVGQPLHEDMVDSTKVGFDGFIDLEGRLVNKNYITDRGFSVNDAALIIRKNFNDAEALVDLPFYTAARGSGSNDFNFGTEYAQAYLNFHNFVNAPVYIRAGQFDSFFGIEANHSKDRFFADAGVLKGQVPWTHTGVLAGYKVAQQFTVQGLIGNGPRQTAADTYSTTTSDGTMANRNPEFAVQGKYDANNMFGGVGYMVDKTYTGNGGSNRMGHLIDVTGGYKMSDLATSAELLWKKNAGPGGVALKDTFGVALLGDYAYMPRMSLGGRIEYASQPVIGNISTQAKNIFEVAVGPVYRLERNITLRGDFTYAHIDSDNAAIKGNDFGISMSAVASLF